MSDLSPVIYSGGKIYRNNFPASLNRTWDYNPLLKEVSKQTRYAKLYCSGKSLAQMTPDSLKGEMKKSSSEVKSHIQAAKTAKIDLSKIPLYQVVPENTMIEFYRSSEKVLQHIFDTVDEPHNYETLSQVNEIIKNIQHSPLFIDKEFLRSFTPKNHLETAFVKKMMTEECKIKYDIFGTITGRMTTDKSGLSIMTMPKELRPAILPENDFLVEIDYNAAELRVALSLLGYPQPKEDIHEWNMSNVFVDTKDRSEAKKKIFAWLYNSKSENAEIEKTYDRSRILGQYYDNEKIKNFFGREIFCEPKVALNYIIQSTAADMFSRQLIKVGEIIKERRTKILYTMHDSIVLDFAHEDREILNTILQEFSATDLGDFLINISVGEKYNQMKVKTWIK